MPSTYTKRKSRDPHYKHQGSERSIIPEQIFKRDPHIWATYFPGQRADAMHSTIEAAKYAMENNFHGKKRMSHIKVYTDWYDFTPAELRNAAIIAELLAPDLKPLAIYILDAMAELGDAPATYWTIYFTLEQGQPITQSDERFLMEHIADEDDPIAMAIYARILQDRGDLEGAAKNLEIATSLLEPGRTPYGTTEPTFWRRYTNPFILYASVLSKMGDTKGTREALQKAADLFDDPNTWLSLSRFIKDEDPKKYMDALYKAAQAGLPMACVQLAKEHFARINFFRTADNEHAEKYKAEFLASQRTPFGILFRPFLPSWEKTYADNVRDGVLWSQVAAETMTSPEALAKARLLQALARRDLDNKKGKTLSFEYLEMARKYSPKIKVATHHLMTTWRDPKADIEAEKLLELI